MSKDEKKDEDGDNPNLNIIEKDIEKDLEEACIQSAMHAIKSYDKGEKLFFKDVAEQIKKGNAGRSVWHSVHSTARARARRLCILPCAVC